MIRRAIESGEKVKAGEIASGLALSSLKGRQVIIHRPETNETIVVTKVTWPHTKGNKVVFYFHCAKARIAILEDNIIEVK